jgi:hypothetical protein
MEMPMNPDPRADPRERGTRLALALVFLGFVVFALGAVIGYHSIYRDISVAMLAPPAGMQPQR